METVFFSDAQAFRKWLEENHKKETELWVGFYKKNSGKANMSWTESVDQALSYGWIDGLRKSIDDISYRIRFTPRRPRSNWSAVNIKKVKELTKKGLMHKSGIEAFEKLDTNKVNRYSSEQINLKFSQAYESTFKKSPKAWNFFKTLPPSVKKQSIWWVMSAKREETRQRRLGILILSSEKEERIPPFRRNKS